MSSRSIVLTLAIPVLAVACVSTQQFLAQMEPMAIQTATSRGQFEMSCQAVNATVLSSEVVQPALEGPLVQGVQRAEYTIGVTGCGDRKTFVVICPEGGDGCFAAGPGGFIRE